MAVLPRLVLRRSAGAFALVASARVPRADGSPRFGRAIYGVVPLPFAGGPRTVLDGFAFVALGLVALGLLPALGWLGASRQGRARTNARWSSASPASSAPPSLAFATRAFERFHARGNVATLWIAAPVIGLTAVAYRIGRPLPPDVVGFRLSIVIALVWLLSRGIVKVGPRLGRALGRPDDGPRYHHVPHFGVLALALLLFVDAVLVGGPTPTRSLAVVPPLLLAGSALGALLLYRSYGREPLLHLGLLFASLASLLAFAQRALLGPALVPLDPPGGRWVPGRDRRRGAPRLVGSCTLLDPRRHGARAVESRLARPGGGRGGARCAARRVSRDRRASLMR